MSTIKIKGNKNAKKIKTIGQMTQSRGDWGAINPVTRVVKNKKGKGSYNRQKFKTGND